jgi:hypothetical protein
VYVNNFQLNSLLRMILTTCVVNNLSTLITITKVFVLISSFNDTDQEHLISSNMSKCIQDQQQVYQ